MSRACVIGSGPNGLAAAIVLAQAGMSVDVFEADAEPGGAVRTLPLTLPGFRHDFGSAVYPFAAGSPFFASLPLADHGLEWIHGEAPLAHPLDDGSAVVLERNLEHAERALGADGKMWRGLMQPSAGHWMEFAEDTLGPVIHIPHHPLRMARFGLTAFQSAEGFAKSHFASARTRAIFAGLAGHSFLSLDQPLSATVGWMFGITVHAVGWPIPRGGAQAVTQALLGYLRTLGGTVHTSCRIDAAAFRELESKNDLVLFDTSPRQLARKLPARRLSPKYKSELESVPARPRRIQSRLRSFATGSMARDRLPSSDHGSSGRHVRGDCGGRIRSRSRARSRAAFRAGCATHALTIHRARRRENMCCGPIATCRTVQHSI